MKKTAALIISIAVFAGAGLFCIVSAAVGLLQPRTEGSFFSASRGERLTVETEYRTSCIYEVDHKVGFIPAGSEYYYAFIGGDSKAYLVRLNKSFGDDLPEGIQHVSSLVLGVTGKVKRLKDTPELRQTAAQLDASGITLSTDLYLDAVYQVNYLWRIAVGAGLLVFTGVMFVNFRKLSSITKRTKIFCNIGTVVGIISMLGGIYLLNMA